MHAAMPLTTGLIVGLGWGLLVALLDGLPLLLQGSPWPHLDARLLAMAYLAVIYGGLGAVAGALLGCVALVVLRLTRRHVSRGVLAAGYAGLLATVTVALLWLQRFSPDILGWLVIPRDRG